MSLRPNPSEQHNASRSASFGVTVPPLDPVLSQARVAYDGPELAEDCLASTPLAQFQAWYARARAEQVAEPNAMTLATVGAAGLPSARTVLLKDAGPAGFTFFTNRTSRKGSDLAAHPAAALVLPWIPLQRQVAVRGLVQELDEQASAQYFVTRPWGSRIGAWASHQSQPVDGREPLERRWAELAARWPDRGRPDDVPVPPHWGGYLVRPFEVEFWQGRPSRLHDRLVFVALTGPDGVTPDGGTSDGVTPDGVTPDELPALDDATGWRIERREP